MHSSRTLAGALVFTFACITFVACSPVAPLPTQVTGQSLECSTAWLPAGNLAQARYGATAVRLANGTVVVAGGIFTDQTGVQPPLLPADAELYDPNAGTWSPAGTLNEPRYYHRAVALRDGRVLVVGGYTSSGSTKKAEVYDPATNTWSFVAPMTDDRYSAQLTLLSDGRVLVSGGFGSNGVNGGYLATAEIYDPARNIWSSAGAMTSPRYGAGAALLSDGRVLVAGGTDGPTYLSSADAYNPATNTWSAVRSMSVPRLTAGTATLQDGKVLMAGGTDNDASFEIYDPGTNTWSVTAENMLQTGLHGPGTFRLPDGRVLIAGGSEGGSRTVNAEIYDPETGKWAQLNGMITGRTDAASTVLLDGRILVAGGSVDDGEGVTNTSEAYTPCAACGGPWKRTTEDLDEARFAAASVRLANGKVLVAGGFGPNGPTGSAELFNPADGTWTPTGGLNVARYGLRAVRLQNGKVLAVGGDTGSGPTNAAETYDPATGSWTLVRSMSAPRNIAQITLLPNVSNTGPVLVSGGVGGGATAEVYDPVGNTWTSTGPMGSERSLGAAVRLANGKVLVAGGDTDSTSTLTPTATAEIYDPATNNWTTATPMSTARYAFGMALLPNGGGVLAAGGAAGGPGAEIYNTTTGAWSPTSNMDQPSRTNFVTVQLTDGRVVVAGGGSNSAEIYDPDLALWSTLAGMTTPRDYAVAAELDNRWIVIASGFTSAGIDNTAETFHVCPPNRRPVAVCRNVTVPTSPTTCSAPMVSVDNGSNDPDNGPNPLSLVQAPQGPYSLGTTPVTLTASDGILSATCSATVTVVDQTKPRITCPSQQFLECVNGGAVGTFTATASDNCGVRTVTCAPSGVTLPLGNTTVNCSATDNSGNVETCSFTATVRDTQPPAPGTSKGIVLWPPDSALHEVTLMDCANFTTDVCSGRLNPLKDYGVITKITSDEEEDAPGGSDGNTLGDMSIKKPWLALIRAERNTARDGRVYTLYYQAKDPSGNTANGSCKVSVPRSSGVPAVEGPPLYCVGPNC